MWAETKIIPTTCTKLLIWIVPSYLLHLKWTDLMIILLGMLGDSSYATEFSYDFTVIATTQVVLRKQAPKMSHYREEHLIGTKMPLNDLFVNDVDMENTVEE